MFPLFAFFGLGPTELVVLALFGIGLLIAVAVVVAVVLVVVFGTRGKKGDPGNE